MQRLFGWVLLLAMAVSIVALCGSVAQASVTGDTISIAFGRDEPPGTPGCFLSPSDVAGAPGSASANWNNEFGNVASDNGLMRDVMGVVSTTSTSISWAADNTWSTEPGAGRSEFANCFGGADEALMTGYLDAGNGSIQGFTSITVTNLPADIAAGYSVVIYSLGGIRNRPAAFYVNDAAQAKPKYIVPGGNSPYDVRYQHLWIGPNYVQSIGDDPDFGTSGSTNDYGNYLVFTGLSGDVSIVAQPKNFRVAVNAIQIVKNP